uniref:Uncharacterized protein n=1 Tax=Corvus moneduloides TaxID=1196302 RepID=A0A8U7NBF0_CORMO
MAATRGPPRVAPRALLTCGRRAAACCTCSVTARSAGPSPSPAAMPALHIPARPRPLPPHTRPAPAPPPIRSLRRPPPANGRGGGAILGRSPAPWRPRGTARPGRGSPGAPPGLPRGSAFWPQIQITA